MTFNHHLNNLLTNHIILLGIHTGKRKTIIDEIYRKIMIIIRKLWELRKSYAKIV